MANNKAKESSLRAAKRTKKCHIQGNPQKAIYL